MMTVAELIEALESYEPEAEVRIATQPNWPLQFHVAKVAMVETGTCPDHGRELCLECGDPDDWDDNEEAGKAVFIVTGEHPDDSPYISSKLWN